MRKCECGNETDWKEVGSTWICMPCQGEEIEKSMRELKEGLDRMEQAERSLSEMKVDTSSVVGLLAGLSKEVDKLGRQIT
jgi:ferredoxin-thioredoxin reductase catalytic subunit